MINTPIAVGQRSKAWGQTGTVVSVAVILAGLTWVPTSVQAAGSEHALHELNQLYLVAGFTSSFVSVPYFLYCSFSRGRNKSPCKNGKDGLS